MQQKWNQSFDGEPMTDIPQKFLNAGCDVYMVMQLRHDEKILDERYQKTGNTSEGTFTMQTWSRTSAPSRVAPALWWFCKTT